MLFGFGWNCKGFVISLFPAVASGLYQVQVGLIMATFVAWLAVQSSFQCWQFYWINVVDTIMCSLVIMRWFGFAMLGSAEQSMEESTCGWLIIALACVALTIILLLANYSFAKGFSSKPRYGVFITYHEAAAALYARQIKMLFQLPGSPSPFLDVDDLDHLDCLYFAVKSSSWHMTILSGSVLQRPWCAVEIVTACLNKVPRVVVQINDEELDLSADYIGHVIASYSSQDLASCLRQVSYEYPQLNLCRLRRAA